MDKSTATGKRVRFGEVVRLVKETCKAPAAAGIKRVIGLEHLAPGDLRIRAWNDVAEGTTFTTRVRPGQVLFGKRRAYQRKVAVADFDAICSGDIYVFESANTERLLPKLLPFICQTDAFFEHAIGTSAGSLSPRTNWSSLAEYEFALPPIGEQARIVACLDASSNYIHTIKELAGIAGTVASAFDEVQISEFMCREPLVPLLEVCELITVGIVVTPARYYVPEGGVPVLRSLNVWPDRFELSELKRISEAGHEIHHKSHLRTGDVVLVRTGDPGRPGNAAVVRREMDGWNAIDLVLIRPARSVRSQFLSSLLNTGRVQQILQSFSPGTKQKHLSIKLLECLKVPVPSLAEQDAFLRERARIRAAQPCTEARLRSAVEVHRGLVADCIGAP